MKRASILLIQPSWHGLGYRRKIKVDEKAVRPLAAATVASLCGDRKVRVIDEAAETLPVDFSQWDIVGITVCTFNARRAFAIADSAKKQGRTVVLGGPHVSISKTECLSHADAVVDGDAEGAFEPLLADFEAGSLKREYSNPDNMEVASPRRDLMAPGRSGVGWMQVSRGCVNSCSFCYLHSMPGHKMRFKRIGTAVEELRSMPERIILFVDDNLFCARDYALEFFRAITPLGKKWWMQAPTNIADDTDLLEAAALSGCFCLSIGFQTASQDVASREMMSHNTIERYAALVEKLQSLGIYVDGTFIFGFDGDTKDTFAATGEMIRKIGLNTYTFYFLTPYPGLGNFDLWAGQGRLPSSVTDIFDWDHPVLSPANMTVSELAAGVRGLYKDLDGFYYWKNYARSLLRMPRRNITPEVFRFICETGLAYYRSPALIPGCGTAAGF